MGAPSIQDYRLYQLWGSPRSNPSVIRMRILHLNTYDTKGGTARGAYWLHRALLEAGLESRMLVRTKLSKDETVVENKKPYSISRWWKRDKWRLRLYRYRKKSTFSPVISSSLNIEQIEAIQPDIVHLHWINGRFVKPGDLSKIKVPIVWTLRDMWPFTGSCHYSEGCTRFKQECGWCPILGSTRPYDLSYRTLNRKQKAWRSVRIHLVAPSSWLASQAQQSSLFKAQSSKVIPNGIDTRSFSGIDTQEALKTLKLPLDKTLLLFGAVQGIQNQIKGFHFIPQVLACLGEKEKATIQQLVIFGDRPKDVLPKIDIPIRRLGHIRDDQKLVAAYSACDVCLFLSTEEAFGKVVIESMACGTPVVCFDTTGPRDIIDHQQNGYRAKCFNPENIAEGIQWVLSHNRETLAKEARKKAYEAFSIEKIAAAYRDLYSELT